MYGEEWVVCILLKAFLFSLLFSTRWGQAASFRCRFQCFRLINSWVNISNKQAKQYISITRKEGQFDGYIMYGSSKSLFTNITAIELFHSYLWFISRELLRWLKSQYTTHYWTFHSMQKLAKCKCDVIHHAGTSMDSDKCDSIKRFWHDFVRCITMAVYEIIFLHFSSKSQKSRNSLPT